jgi:hypothetical protein
VLVDGHILASPASSTRVRIRGAEARAPRTLLGLTLIAIASALALSPFALTRLGINYGDTGGSLAAKIHPATYVLVAALLARLILHKHPARSLIAAVFRHRGAAIFLWMVASLIAYVAVNLHLPLSSLLDTFLFPIMALILLDGIDEKSARLLARLVHAIYAANAALALFEMASGWRLTPLIIQGIDLSEFEHRSSALLGHPLANAMLTGLYVVVLAAGGGRDLPGWARFPAMILQMAAMVAFGGRLATVTMLLLLGLLALRGLGLILAGRRFNTSSAAVYLTLLPVMIVALVGAYGSGFFDQFIERFINDDRSAQARVIMFDLFSHFSCFQLLFGTDPDLLSSVKWTEGIEFGVESFWVSFCLTYGAIPSLLFFFGLFAFCLDLWRHSGKGSVWTIVYFLIVISGSLSIGDKTLALGVLVIANMILLRAPAKERMEFAWPRTRGAAGLLSTK